MATEQTQPRRTYNSSGIIVAFARQGIAIDTMSRALVVSEDFVKTACSRAMESGALVAMPPESAADRKTALQVELTHVRAQLDDANYLLREIQAEKSKDGRWSNYVAVAGITGKEAMLLFVLLESHGRVAKERLYHELYGMRNPDEQPDPKIVDVFVCKIRAKLKPFDIEIDTVWGHGYVMTPQNRNKMKRLAGILPVPFVESPSLVPEVA